MVLLALTLACTPKHATAVHPVSEDAMPLDPTVRSGVLDNGLTWFVEENGEPDQRAELRLVVRAGSVLEDDDQLGLAHFLEHMAFNGSEHFEGNALIEYMESIGMRFGAHLNASTSFDETIYLLTVPTDDPAVLDRGMLMLRDQAGGLTLDPAEVEAERGVVLSEWRSSLGAGRRMMEASFQGIFAGSPYGGRLPIGTEASLMGFDPAALERFYRDWYRPDLMGVIAVGDFDGARVEGLIRDHFGDLRAPAQPRPRPTIEIPPREGPVYTILTDREQPRTFLELADQVDAPHSDSYTSYRDFLVRNLFFAVVGERFDALSQEAGSPLLGAGAGWTRHNAVEGQWTLGAAVREGQVLPALELLGLEAARLRRHGITEAELSRARARVQADYTTYSRERDKTDSGDHADEIVRHFTVGEAMPGVELECELAFAWLPEITAAEVNALAAGWMTSGSLVVQVAMPEKDGLAAPTEADLAAVLAAVEAQEIAAPEAEAEARPLLAAPPPEGGASVVERGEIEALGVTTWTLSNGVRVWLKPTDFKEDEILLQATSPGGLSLVSDADYIPAASATGIQGDSGLGPHSATELQRLLQGSRVSGGIGVGSDSELVSGRAPPEGLETLLQLVYLGMTEPRLSEDGFTRYRRDLEEGIRNRRLAPGAVFNEAYQQLLWEDSPRVRPWTEDMLPSLDLDQSAAFLRARFANAADFTFVFVGNLDLAAAEPLVTRYLGQLPASEAREQAGLDTRRMRTGARETVVRAGVEPRARVVLTWHGDLESTWESRNQVQAVQSLLDGRLRSRLREELGGVYGVQVGVQIDDDRSEFDATIAFTCDPDRVDELKAEAMSAVVNFARDPVSDAEIATEQQKNQRAREESVRSNGFWLNGIVGALERGEDPVELTTWEARNQSLNATELRDLAARIFGTEHHIDAVMLPAL